jgi:hypothetical protein
LSIESIDEEVGVERPSRWRRWWWWVCAAGLVVLLLLTPPLLNVNRLRRRIADSISASLGRPVHLDNVTLHLLPVPGFTLQNLVVSEDPAFGAEPIIRANTVEVTLRPSSLWRRHVEIATISFEQPSLNLVRNANGEWNVQSLLMHAAQVTTAPTAQRRPGPAPRFPYIEASGARVNLKLGEEKKPFSLTEADFALWLTSPQEWRVRLKGTPTRTDTNISDPGTVRLEGSLQRAGTMAEVPVDLTASWSGAPMGEASKLLMGEDAGWRGNLSFEATLVGTLAAAKLAAKVHMEDLRRAAFVPVETMDVQADCTGTLDVTAAGLQSPNCSVGAPVPEGSKVAGQVVAIADRVDLAELSAKGLRVGMTNVSDAWLLDWARLFSQRIPAGERPGGTLAGTGLFASARKGAAAEWQGEVHGEIDGVMPWKPVESGFAVHPVSVSSSAAGFVLEPMELMAPEKTPGLVMSGSATKTGYALTLSGSATEAQVMALRGLAPPLGDGMAGVVREGKVDVTCARAWGGAQSCAAAAVKAPRRRRR